MNLTDRIAILHTKDKNKTCAAVIRLLREKHINVTPSQFSLFDHGILCTQKSELVISEATKIVEKWEQDENSERD